jgi:hypothetical protein
MVFSWLLCISPWAVGPRHCHVTYVHLEQHHDFSKLPEDRDWTFVTLATASYGIWLSVCIWHILSPSSVPLSCTLVVMAKITKVHVKLENSLKILTCSWHSVTTNELEWACEMKLLGFPFSAVR